MSFPKKRDEGRIVLSERDTPRILRLLGNPAKQTPALLAAARRRFGTSKPKSRPV